MDTDENIKIMNEELKKIKENFVKSLNNYGKTMSYLAADAPIAVLCLPKAVETALSNAGCLRVYDLLDRDLTKIKGLGKRRVGDLTARLNKFLSIS